jgi:hypothetical protein
MIKGWQRLPFTTEIRVMKIRPLFTGVVLLLSLAACSSMQVGGGSSPVTGSAGSEGTVAGAAPQLVQCTAPIGTIALVES